MKETQTLCLIGLFCTSRLHQNEFIYTERNNIVDEVFAWLRALQAKWCWIWIPHSGRLSAHLPGPSMPSSSGKHSVPLALFPRGILPARLVTFLTISTSLKMVWRFFLL